MEPENYILQTIINLGEGQTIEFKESPSKLDREIVAFANACGGSIYCGIKDNGEIVGTKTGNSVRSQVQDFGRNCDPPVALQIHVLSENVLQIEVPESEQKPHQCSSGFYLRVGANCQKLRTTEIQTLINKGQSFFDSRINSLAEIPKNFSPIAYQRYCELCNISSKRKYQEILESLSVAKKKNGTKDVFLTNAGVLLFSNHPKEIIPESYLTVVRYCGIDKFSILDRQDFDGNIIDQIESGLSFAKKHIEVSYEISGAGQRTERYRYPLVAIREALINALVHRDYAFQNSCVYLNIFSDRIEIENPGGIQGNRSVEDIEGKSIRRNPMLSDLLFRAGYGEKLGSGLFRIRDALRENGNPSYHIVATNFFSIRFLPRVISINVSDLNDRQLNILIVLGTSNRPLSSKDLSNALSTSPTTISRDLKELIRRSYVKTIGNGKTIRYVKGEIG